MYFYVIFVALVLAVVSFFALRKPREKSLRNARVLLTGAARGLGRSLAFQLAQEGCSLVLWDINAALLRELERDLESSGVEVETRCVDVGDEAIVKNEISSLERRKKLVDIVINNAGVLGGKKFDALSLDEMRKTLNVNAMGGVYVLKYLLPSLISRGSGHIVTVSSVLSQFYAAGLTDYCMSKAALSAFHNCLRLELRQKRKQSLSMNIGTTLVLPYTIDTGMFKGVKQPFIVSLIFPTLSVDYVAKKIILAVKTGQEILVEPYLVAWAMPLVGLLPVRVRDILTEFVGGGCGMDSFSGYGQQ